MKQLILLLLCIIVMALAKPGKKKHTSILDKKLKNKKEEIKKTKCSHLGDDF